MPVPHHGWSARIVQVVAARNRTNDENKVLEAKIEDLKHEAAREKANSHAAWVQNQQELLEVPRGLGVLQCATSHGCKVVRKFNYLVYICISLSLSIYIYI